MPPQLPSHLSLLKANFLVAWLVLACLLLALGGAIAFALYEDHERLESRERERLSNLAKVVNDNLGNQLANVKRTLIHVREQVPEWRRQKDGMTQANAWLDILDEALPSVRTINIIDSSGIVMASNRAELLGADFHERAYFQAPLTSPSTKTLYLEPPFKTSLGVWAMNVVMMIPDAQGNFAGLVSATLDPNEFNVLMESVRYAPDVSVGLNHGDGVTFMSSPPREESYGKNLAGLGGFYDQHVNSGKSENLYTGVMKLNGERRMTVLRTIQPPELDLDKSMMVAVSRNLDIAFANWNNEVQIRGGLFFLLSMSSIASLFLLQRRRKAAEYQAAQAEARLLEMNREIEEFFSLSADLFCIATLGGKLLKVNPSWERLLGYALPQLEQRSFSDFIHPDDIESTTTAVKTLSTSQNLTLFTNRYRCADGRFVTLSWNATAVDGLIYAVARDMTENAALEEELKSNAELEQFAYVVSHDLREPLRMVSSFVTLLERKFVSEKDEEAHQFIGYARDGALRMDRMIRHLLDYSRIGKSNAPFAKVDLNSVLSEALLNLGPMLMGTKGRVDPLTDLPLVMGDRDELVRLFQNLIGNALKYCSQDRMPVVTIRAAAEGRDCVISLADNGIGISSEHFERIFGIFQRLHTQEKYEGSGIGLALCKKIIERHNGKIWVESKLGEGTTFYLSLPCIGAD